MPVARARQRACAGLPAGASVGRLHEDGRLDLHAQRRRSGDEMHRTVGHHARTRLDISGGNGDSLDGDGRRPSPAGAPRAAAGRHTAVLMAES